jgi:hypothetical protein
MNTITLVISTANISLALASISPVSRQSPFNGE